ncbi:response regulator [Sneathiella aquimaris]|uniref:response regulator n=1 Tax=Sneathiella aquimaris TaxID=2599305 RepID=UPI00146D3771|nr:response regulator [Sneathiella aquimaris]
MTSNSGTAPEAKKLLIIDDERDFGDYVGEVGKELGFQAVVTDNASDFMKSYQAQEPAVIVLDMVMPGVDGVELIGWLAKQKCQSRILIVTGFNPRYAELAEDLGGAKGLRDIKSFTKPIRLADLRAALSLPE